MTNAGISCRVLVKLMPLVALVAAPSTSAKPASDPALKRTGAWAIEYADNACHLSAPFGSGSDAVTIRFTRVAPQDSLQLTLAGARFKSQLSLTSRSQIWFMPSNDKPTWSTTKNGTASFGGATLPAVFAGPVRLDNRATSQQAPSGLQPISPEIEATVSGLSVRAGSAKPFILGLESMREPMAAMHKCTDDLVRSWGYDPAEISGRRTRAAPITNPATWVRTGDYPSGMLQKGASALVDFRLSVDEAGAVTDCFVLEQTQPVSIGPHTCNLIVKRARFRPSIGQDGKPAKDFYINRIFWRAE